MGHPNREWRAGPATSTRQVSAWCHGSGISLADVAVGCALAYVSFRLSEIAWAVQYPNLGAFHAKLMQRPSFAETVPVE